MGLWSPSSALQVGMVKNVKFDHDFATFFGMFLLKYYTVHFLQDEKKYQNFFVILAHSAGPLPNPGRLSTSTSSGV